MKKLWTFILLVAGLAVAQPALAQNSNEGLPENVRKTDAPRFDVTSYYGTQLPTSSLAFMNYIHYSEALTDDLLVYPNPVQGITHIALHEPSQANVFVVIMNMNANIVSAWVFPPGSVDLQLSLYNLPQGLYSVRVFGPTVSFHNMKVVKSDG